MLSLREDLFKKPVFLAVALAWAGSCKLYLWDQIFLHSFPACRWLRKIIVLQVYDRLLSWWHSLVCWSFYCTLCTGRLPRKAWICCVCNCCKYRLYEYITYPQKYDFSPISIILVMTLLQVILKMRKIWDVLRHSL